MPASEPTVRIEDMRFAYPGGEFALDVPALNVDPGETVAVVGPSGAGKSTLLNLIAGVLRPASGRVVVHGTEISALAEAPARAFRAQSIGFVLQDFGLLDYLSAVDNILHPYRLCSALRLGEAEMALLLGAGAALGAAALAVVQSQGAALVRALVFGA